MKALVYRDAKNEWLKRHRGLTFDEVIVVLLTEGPVLDIEHPRQDRYPGQRLLVIKWNGYPHCIPVVEDETTIRLITIFPNRLYKKYVETHEET